MKKYLMTGMAAIAICAAFTSCSKSTDLYDEGQIQQNSVEKIKADYDAAFIATFGKPAANQDWGFGTSRSNTRTENANANEWADPDKAYGGLLVPPAITPEQAAVVKAYFQTVPNLGYKDPQWSNYFIQQVYKGNPETAGAYSPEKYLAADGQNYILASDHMDHLLAIDPDRNLVDHINNFNHGDCSPNGDVLNNGEHVGGAHHTDKIMYMMNSTTKSFAYHNSDGSLYHTEYTGLVSWKTIHDWALTNYTGYDGCLNDTWNRSYMGFDFEQIVGDDVYAKNVDWSRWTAPENQVEGVEYIENCPVTGYKFYTFEGNNYNYLITNRNQYAADKNEKSFIGKYNNKVTTPGIADFDNEPNSDVKRELLEKGYLPVDNTADKTWVKVGGTADGYYSDWIVTLTEAKTENNPNIRTVTESLRVIAEDLSIDDRAGNTDFDFNDVVYDVVLKKTYKDNVLQSQEVKVILKAAGGTLPLYIDDKEVHALYQQANPTLTIDQYTMINTHAELHYRGISGLADIEFTPDYYTGTTVGEIANSIKVYVTKNGVNCNLTAPQGDVASKIAVGTDYEWCDEREDIESKYSLKDGTSCFKSYVQGTIGDDWYKLVWDHEQYE